MKNTLKDLKIILASKSPRRRQLMELLNIPFEVVTADINETINKSNDLRKEIEKLSYLKAKKVYDDHKDCLVIGSDTIVVINGLMLGKPKDEKDAFRMLKMLESNKHQVITAVTILYKDNIETFSTQSDVYFDEMDNQEIMDYINTKEPMDKAGSYAIQGIGGKYIKRIDGDYYSIMGLPINELHNRLKKYLQEQRDV